MRRILMDLVLQDPFENERFAEDLRALDREMHDTTLCFLEKELLPQCAGALDQVDTLAARYRSEGAVYGIEVIFPGDGDHSAESREGWRRRIDHEISKLRDVQG